jgi:hypothetical protein
MQAGSDSAGTEKINIKPAGESGDPGILSLNLSFKIYSLEFLCILPELQHRRSPEERETPPGVEIILPKLSSPPACIEYFLIK